MENCLCCHSVLLRQVVRAQIHWYCPNCRQLFPGKTTLNCLVAKASHSSTVSAHLFAHPPEAASKAISVGHQQEGG